MAFTLSCSDAFCQFPQCATFLSLAMNAPMKAIIDSAAAQCGSGPEAPGPTPCEPNPCHNGGQCRVISTPVGPGSGGGHRRAQSTFNFECRCAEGFSGAECRDGTSASLDHSGVWASVYYVSKTNPQPARDGLFRISHGSECELFHR